MSGYLFKDNFFAQWSENELYFEWQLEESDLSSSLSHSVHRSPNFNSESYVDLKEYETLFDMDLNNFILNYARSMKLTIHDVNGKCRHTDNNRIISNWNNNYKQKKNTISLCSKLHLKLCREFPIIVRCAINCVETFSHRWNENSSNCSNPIEKVNLLKEPTSQFTGSFKSFKECRCSLGYAAPNSSSQLALDWKDFFDKAISTDVVLNVGGNSIKVHKTVLQARSPVFLKIIDHSTSEASENVVNIPDISSESMTKFVSYLYSGTLEKCSFEETLEMYYAADKYEVLTLREECVPELLKNLQVNNACTLFAFASRHGDETLKEKTVQFASARFESVIETKSFEELCADDVKTFTRLCTRNKKK